MFGLMKKKDHLDKVDAVIKLKNYELTGLDQKLAQAELAKKDLADQLDKSRKKATNLTNMLWALSDYSGHLTVGKSSYGTPNPYLYTVSIKPTVTCLGDQYHCYNNELVMRVVAEVGVRGWHVDGDRLEMETHDEEKLSNLRAIIQELNDTLRQLCSEAVKLQQLQKAIAKPKKKEAE